MPLKQVLNAVHTYISLLQLCMCVTGIQVSGKVGAIGSGGGGGGS